MKNKLRFLITSLFFFFTTNSFSNTIDKINFIGLNNSTEDKLLQLIPFIQTQMEIYLILLMVKKI